MNTRKSALMIACLSASLLASQPVMAADPCAMVLCMAGEAMGKGGGGACKGPIKDYFSIIKFKEGKFSASRTARARASKLNQCAGADSGTKSMIGGKFGRLYSF